MFTPKHPTINPKRSTIERTESVLDIERLEEEAIKGIELIEVYPD